MPGSGALPQQPIFGTVQANTSYAISSIIANPRQSQSQQQHQQQQQQDHQVMLHRQQMHRANAAAMAFHDRERQRERQRQIRDQEIADGIYSSSTHRHASSQRSTDPQRHHHQQQMQMQMQMQMQAQQAQAQAQAQAHPSSRSTRSSSSQPQQHRVYLLNCKHCNNFLTDRGMKAVLLLKPNITLFSTDAIPSNCGPLFTPTEFGPGGGRASAAPERTAERTCECLTQTIGCHGCGSAIGYSILSPCSRCTSSVLEHQRSSNGHRTVLHCSEITVRERRYVPGEPSVMVAPPPPAVPSLSSPVSRASSPFSRSIIYDPDGNMYESSQWSGDDMFDVVEAEKAEAALAAAQAAAEAAHAAALQQQLASQSRSSSRRPKARNIRRGEAVYWSDLVPGGERSEPFDSDISLAMPISSR